jgi:hypothetical protein
MYVPVPVKNVSFTRRLGCCFEDAFAFAVTHLSIVINNGDVITQGKLTEPPHSPLHDCIHTMVKTNR